MGKVFAKNYVVDKEILMALFFKVNDLIISNLMTVITKHLLVVVYYVEQMDLFN